MMFSLSISIISILFFEVILAEEFPNLHTIKIQEGSIRGKLNETLFDKSPYYSFRGIPFAEPPIGDLRFKVIKNSLNIVRHYKKISSTISATSQS